MLWQSKLFCSATFVKNNKFFKKSTTTKARETNKQRFGILRIFSMYVWLYLKTIKFFSVKLDTDFYWLTKLLGERAILEHL